MTRLRVNLPGYCHEKTSGHLHIRHGDEIGLLSNALVFALTLPFLLVGSGASIRPLGWGLLVLVIALLALCAGLPASRQDFRNGHRLRGLAGVVLALMPFPLASVLLHACAALKGFGFAP